LRKSPWLLLLLPAFAFADDVYLKGGAVFSGRIVSQTETMITIDIGDGQVGVALARVDRIVKGHSALDEYDARAAKTAPNDANGWRGLGLWAAQQGLSKQSHQAYEKVLSLAPDDAEARQALGFVLVDGKWLTEEESYRARGFVKFHGEWMTAAEAQMERASEDATRERQEAETRANQAEADKILAESRAQKAEQRAQDAEARESSDNWGNPVYMGGWGYGVNVWPSTTQVRTWPAYQPPQTGTRP
jgi:tetratricopeptide (TPR) repeat protein